MSDNTRLGINITATDNNATATLKNLTASARALEQAIVQMGAAARPALQAELDIVNKQIAAFGQQAQAVKAVTAALQEQSAAFAVQHRSLQEGINAAMGMDRAISSASASARTLATSLSAAAEADSRARDASIAEAAAMREQQGILARIVALRAEDLAMRRESVVQTLTGGQVFGGFERRMGIGQQPLSAAASAAAFQAQLGPAGTGITSAETRATIDSLQGVNRELLSAKDSAQVFVNALGPVGAGVVMSGTKATIDSIQGINREVLSAAESAKVFQRELGTPGGGLTLTPAAGFSKMVGDLAGVKQSYLSAADSARVFEQAIPDAGRAAGFAGVFQRETKHIVAAFDSLASGHRGQLFSSIGSAARDAGLGVGSLAGSVAVLAAVMGTAAILRGAESMGKWATETRAAASAAGMSIQAYSSLQGALSLVGVKGTEADATLRRLAVNTGAAISDPASLTAQAFHNLGISQDQLVATGGNVAEVLKLLADAFTRNADGANKSANMNEILGRGFEKLIPALQQGSAGMGALQAKAQSLGLTLDDETARGLEKTGENARDLADTIEGRGIKAFIAWEPVINTLIDSLRVLGNVLGVVTEALGKLGSFEFRGGVIGMLLRSPLPGMSTVRNLVGLGEEEKKPPVPAAAQVQPPPLIKHGGTATPLEQMRLEMAQAGNAAAQGAKTAAAARQAEGQAEIAVMQKTLQTATLNAAQRTQIEAELANKQMSLRNSQLSAADSAGKRAAKQSYEDFAAGEKLKISEAQGNTQKIIATYDEWIAAANSKYKQHVNVIIDLERQKTQAINAARLADVKEQAQLTEKMNRAQVVLGQGAIIAGGGKEMPAQQQVAALQGQAQQIASAAANEVAALQDIMSKSEEGSATQKEAANEILAIVTQSKQQEIELYNKAAEATNNANKKAVQSFTQVFDSFGSGMESAMNSIFKAIVAPQVDYIKAGLTTVKINERSREIEAAAGKLLMSLGDSILKGLGDLASKMAGQLLAKAIGVTGEAATGGLGSVLGAGVGKLFGVASKAPEAASFGLAGTQLQLAATQLQAAAVALTGAGGAGAAGGVGAAAGGAAVSSAAAQAPTIAAITTASSAQVAATTAAAAAGTADVTAQTAALTGAIAASTATESAAMQIPKPFGFARGGIVPSAQGGMVVGGVGNRGIPAILHAREMVLPAHLSEGIQRMISSPGGVNTHNANLSFNPTVNVASRGRGGTGMTRSEFSQMLTTHSGALLGEARNMSRSGWRPA